MGAVQSHHLGVVEGGLSHGLKQTALLGDPIHFIEHVKQTLGLERVEHVADVTVARDVFDAEEGLRVVGTAPGLHVPLPLKKEGAQGDIGHAVANVLAGAMIWQVGGAVAQSIDQIVETGGLHESGRRPSNTSPRTIDPLP